MYFLAMADKKHEFYMFYHKIYVVKNQIQVLS
jgi:hypothetical protein